MTSKSGVVRRWSIWVFAVATSPFAIGCCHVSRPPDDAISVTVVDVHTHVFNARDLPLAGILNAKGVPMGVATTLAKILDWWTPSDDRNGAPMAEIEVRAPATSDLGQVAASIRAKVTSNRNALAIGSLFPSMTGVERSDLLAYAGVTPQQQFRIAAENDQFEVMVVAKALKRAQFPPSCRKLPPFLVRLQAADLTGDIRFLGIVTESHLGIARQVSRSEYPKVGLFVYHMMDMANAYADKPAVPFDVQWSKMAALDSSFDGRFVHFVAFDPFRRKDALDYVKRGLAAGAIGVKFYPPSGYRAACNAIPPQPSGDADAIARWQSRYGGPAPLSPNELDKINDALFQYCETNDIPIFAHCTPAGFEAADGYGLMSDPKYWACALEKHKGLRLCLAHSGGDAYWFAAGTVNPPIDSFGEEVVQLCLKYPKVYCDTGYLEQISDHASQHNFRIRLAEAIGRRSDMGDWKFGDKLMYGSDWYMLSREPHPETYLQEFWSVFKEPKLLPWRRAFFGGNAVEFLQLAQLAARPDHRFADAQRTYWQKIVAATKPRP